ncbi:hypothetical protein BKA67DRAFT_523368 [Truncatella angustata]|uniref:NB-ARC domain-containing protein n=1 Tax=Truncatella angustata TaxID=152316 RepID=A0A9P8RQ97_9PEZI|nr:uncharacterized protein BKA67DRAFT_523368 [Truncatella angustata]KAH6647383.1 hypothetical protein BKA67DRAFT_523368 [Truncatella angustata]
MSEATQEAYLLVPFGQNDEFVGRESILIKLVGKILPNAKKNDCQRTVIEGLGGVGKTQIALEAAYRVYDQDSDCSIFWVPAVTLMTFENGYREIGEALETPGIDDKRADVMTLVKMALEKSAVHWLLIIDSIDDVSLLDNRILQDYLPFNRKGSILFTTRNHEVAIQLDISKKDTFIINEMSEDEALVLLQNGLKERQYRDIEATKNLIRHLVCLPLAIKQASAYMTRTNVTTVTYLQQCLASDKTQIDLLNTDFEERRRYSKNTNPITMTWLISFHHLEQSYPLAIEYLKFICFLAEKSIPISLLPPGEDEQVKEVAIGILQGYAFISMQEQADSFDIHRLVRLATRNWIQAEWAFHCTRVIRHLAKVYPLPKEENRQVWTKYMLHAEIALLEQQCNDREAEANLLSAVARSYNELGKYEEDVELRSGSPELWNQLLDLYPWSPVDSTGSLTNMLDSQGKYEKAERMHRRTLDLRRLLLDANHPSTLESMNDLAEVLHHRGKYEEAEQIHRETLELKKSVLGLDHPSTLNSMNNLAHVLDNLGKYEEAEKMHRETLQLYKLVLGLNHPSTLDSMNNLAYVLDSLREYEEAEDMHRETLQLYKLVLGLNHPSTLDSMNNLAYVLDNLGKYEEAEEMHRETLQLYKLVLGLNHPSTLGSMNNLANVLDSLGKYEEAEEMHRETLQLYKLVLGLNHPSTLGSMNNLANVLDSLGKYEEVEKMHRETLQLYKLVLGLNHPSTLGSMNNLANVLDSLGKYEEAEEMYRETRELRKLVLGLDHPSTLDSMNNLAHVLDNPGKYKEAEEMHRETLQLYKLVLGLNHPSTLDSMNNLAHVLDNLGKYEEAEEMYRETLELKKSVLGSDHPSTIQSRDDLGELLKTLDARHEGSPDASSDDLSEGGVALNVMTIGQS